MNHESSMNVSHRKDNSLMWAANRSSICESASGGHNRYKDVFTVRTKVVLHITKDRQLPVSLSAPVYNRYIYRTVQECEFDTN